MKNIKQILIVATLSAVLFSCNKAGTDELNDNIQIEDSSLESEEELKEDTLAGEESVLEDEALETETDEGKEEQEVQNEQERNFLFSFDDDALQSYFGDFKNAAFVISDGEEERIYNEELSNARKSPYSTFKIPNSLIALETGVITKEDSFREWDGIVSPREEVNRDMDLKLAFEHSAVWYYQTLAREIGMEKMQEYLNRMNYGNMDCSGEIDKFWLGSPLLISPVEQVRFLEAFYNNEFDFSDDTIQTVKSVMSQEQTELELHGKTGSSGNGMAWFVGYLIVEERPYYFAAYVEDDINGPTLRDYLIDVFGQILE